MTGTAVLKNSVIAGFVVVTMAFVAWSLNSNSTPFAALDLENAERSETQVNTFTSSSQSAATIASSPDGNFVVAWHSRRQQNGSYGVYLQRYDRNGNPIDGETQANLFTRSMQMNPAVACDENGFWVAWESYGQDESFNAIVARRFEGPEFAGGDEILVNQTTKGDQSSVVLHSDERGNATFYWVTPNQDGSLRQIVSRSFDTTGSPKNNETVVSQSSNHQSLPTLAAGSGSQHVLVWSEQTTAGQSSGIQGLTIGDDVRKLRIKDELAIEPAVGLANNGDIAVSWLRPSGDDYEIAAQLFDRNGESTSSVMSLSDRQANSVSGVAVVADRHTDQFVAIWNQQTDTAGRAINVVGRRIMPNAKVSDVFNVNDATDGTNRLGVASGKQRAIFDHGKLVVAWNGASDQDASAVNLTAITRSGDDFRFGVAKTAVQQVESTAKPHEPPTFDPKLIARDPFGGFGAPGPVGADFGFVAINSTGWTPPDPIMAVGPNHVVAMTNGAIAFFTKDGTLTFSDEIENSFGFWGGQGATNFVFDPEVLFDPHSQRFFAMANERSGSQSYFLLAVSDDDDPNGSWNKYRFNVTGIAASNIDSPNMAVDDDVVYLTADFFGPDRYLVYMLRKSDLLAGNSPQTTNLLITGSQSYGLPLIYDANAPAFYMLQAFEFGTYNTVRMHAITDALGSPQRVTTDVSVPTYGHPNDPPQQGTSNRPELFEARFWSCVYRNGSLWAVHHQSPGSGRARVRWYEFDMRGWPDSGQLPTLVQSGDIEPTNNGGQTSWTFFPSIWVDEDNNAAITMARSSTSEFITMARALRSASDPLGTFQPVQNVYESGSPYTAAGRWGDYSGTNDDPSSSGVFWGIHEFVESPSVWQTYIAKYELSETVTPNAVTAETGTIAAGDATSVAQSDDIRLDVSAGVPAQAGDPEISVLFLGNAVDTDFGTLKIVLETSANTPNLLQSIEMFDHVANEYEEVDMRTAEVTESQIEIVLTDDVTRFVTPGSGQIISRLNYKAQGPVLFFPWSIEVDQLNWMLGN